VLSGLKRFVLWDYPRGVWQYDVMVGIILLFIFLTPRAWFRDQPRVPRISQIAPSPAGHDSNVFWIEPELLTNVAEGARLSKSADILKAKTGKQHTITRLEPIYDSEEEIKGYMAFTRP
jgi:hypothetical protein